jgi:hypothetical protein
VGTNLLQLVLDYYYCSNFFHRNELHASAKHGEHYGSYTTMIWMVSNRNYGGSLCFCKSTIWWRFESLFHWTNCMF